MLYVRNTVELHNDNNGYGYKKTSMKLYIKKIGENIPCRIFQKEN